MAGHTGRSMALGVSLLAGSILFCGRSMAEDAPKAAEAGAKAPTTQKSSRTLQQVMEDFQEASKPLRGILSPEVMTDAAKRKETAPKAVPVLKKMLGFMTELRSNSEPQGKMIASQIEPQLYSLLVIFDDSDTKAKLEKQAQGADKEQAAGARGAMIMANWSLAENDAKAQDKVAGEAEQLAKDFPDNPLAQQLNEQFGSQMKLAKLKDQPLTLEGMKNDGKTFSTADWKGKVILVDFWATWCGPCLAELPRVKKAYADFHGKGLEILGVSCDQDGAALSKFLAQNKDMPWPQLFDAKTPGWHPLAKQYGITGIPTMFLIDKKGVCRSVTARENFEELIPKMLEEK
jgi:thiol-disulfide isomerase/thioredoxin